MEIEVVDHRKSEDCGCLEYDWVIGVYYIVGHLEPDGSGHLFLDLGDYEEEKLVDCNSVKELRNQAYKWAIELYQLHTTQR